MMKWKRFTAGFGLLMLLGLVPVAIAEDPAAPEGDDPATVDEPAAPEPRDEADAEGIPFKLYLGFAGGQGSSDPVNTSIFNDELNGGIGEFELEEQLYGKAAIGWKLPHQKGDFRFVFQGTKEEDYRYTGVGATVKMPNNQQADLDSGLVPWWFVSVSNGNFESTRYIPMWNLTVDAMVGDGDGQPDFGACSDIGGSMMRCGEITYDLGAPDAQVTGLLPDNFENRVTTYDVMYGREFGGRRFSSRWWAGLRYVEYEGHMLATAWLNTGQNGATAGEHFTDGAFLKMLQFTQSTTGVGPMGSWEIDFNFFDRALQLYMRGEAAFTMNSMEADSGPFFQIVDEGSSTSPAVQLQDRLAKDLDKSSWQNRGEVGARLYMKNGLHFEVAYAIAGYLDMVLMPDLLQIGITNPDPQTVSHDLVIDSVHFGAGFQF